MSRRFLLGSGILSSLAYLAMDVLGTIYNILLILFAAAVASSARLRSMRIAAASLAAIGVSGLVSAFFPIHMRGGAWTINETMHVTLTAVTVVLIVIAMLSAASAAGRGFFAYSIISIAVMLLFGALAGSAGAAIAEDLPTPWIGMAPRDAWPTHHHELHLRGHHVSH